MSGERKWPIADALKVANELIECMVPFCHRAQIAGSIRRKKNTVGDIELLFIPKLVEKPLDLFSTHKVAATDEWFESALKGIILKRPSKIGVFTWGPDNKLAVHCASGIPVDFFATTDAKWWNSLVVRTGGKESNLQLTTAAQRQGWRFEAYGSGFHSLTSTERFETNSERDVFEFVGLPYKEPHLRQ